MFLCIKLMFLINNKICLEFTQDICKSKGNLATSEKEEEEATKKC